MNRVFVIASNNEGKIFEMRNKLKDFGIEVISQKEAGINTDVEETGETFEENAIIKAQEIYKITNKPVIADDSGLEVDALEGKPGVYSKRFAGIEATDKDRTNKILELMKNVPEEKRTARFKCVICYIDEKGEKHIFEGESEGRIGYTPKGENGFGYDPIFVYNNKTFAEMTNEEKNQVSHRGRAINKFLDYLNSEK